MQERPSEQKNNFFTPLRQGCRSARRRIGREIERFRHDVMTKEGWEPFPKPVPSEKRMIDDAIFVMHGKRDYRRLAAPGMETGRLPQQSMYEKRNANMLMVMYDRIVERMHREEAGRDFVHMILDMPDLHPDIVVDAIFALSFNSWQYDGELIGKTKNIFGDQIMLSTERKQLISSYYPEFYHQGYLDNPFSRLIGEVEEGDVNNETNLIKFGFLQNLAHRGINPLG